MVPLLACLGSVLSAEAVGPPSIETLPGLKWAVSGRTQGLAVASGGNLAPAKEVARLAMLSRANVAILWQPGLLKGDDATQWVLGGAPNVRHIFRRRGLEGRRDYLRAVARQLHDMKEIDFALNLESYPLESGLDEIWAETGLEAGSAKVLFQYQGKLHIMPASAEGGYYWFHAEGYRYYNIRKRETVTAQRFQVNDQWYKISGNLLAISGRNREVVGDRSILRLAFGDERVSDYRIGLVPSIEAPIRQDYPLQYSNLPPLHQGPVRDVAFP